MKASGLALFAILLLCAVQATPAQSRDASWRLALPGWDYQFPRDHGNHPGFRTEWWYFTGQLRDDSGKEFGFQVTFFRHGLHPDLPAGTSRFVMRDLKFAHFAITDTQSGKFHHWQKSARGAFKEAGFGEVDASLPETRLAWIENWNLRWNTAEGFLLESSSESHGVKLRLSPGKPPVVHGENGISRKAEGEGRASHYYSFSRLNAKGELTADGEPRQVAGEAWFDHEWASNQLTADQVGWNWFSIQMDDGTELMLYQMRLANGGVDLNSSGTFIDSFGVATHLRVDDYKLVPLTFWEKYPISWRVEIPKLSFSAEVRTPLPDQELKLQEIAYWEGLIHIRGRRGGRDVGGHGYLEMTGYRQPLNPLRSAK